MKVIAIAVMIAFAAMVFAFRPVCVPIPQEALLQFNDPIEQRSDRDFYVKVFQQRDGRWHHCKTWVSRRLFF
jgi:hypothetical protein